MDPYAPEGILPNFLRWMDRPGQVVRNTLRGNPGAAGRQLLDFLGETADAALPGDLIPSATKRDDYVSGSELVGMDDAPWYLRVPTDIGVSVATDPLSFLSFGGAGAARNVLQAGIPLTKAQVPLATFKRNIDPLSLITDTADAGIIKGLEWLDEAKSTGTVAGKTPSSVAAYENVKAKIRSATGSEDISDPVKRILQSGAAEGGTARRVYGEQAQALMQGLDKEERVLLGAANAGIDIGSLKPGAGVTATALPSSDFLANVDTLARTYGKDPVKLKAIAQRISDLGQEQFDELVGKGAFFKAPGQNQQYMQRQWLLQSDEIPGAVTSSTPNSAKKVVLDTPQARADFLNTGDVGLELDAARLIANRGQQQATMLERARIAKELGGTGSTLPELVSSAKASAKFIPGLAKDDLAAISRALDGMPPREGLSKLLRMAMPPAVKGAMVYGVVLPKFGSMVRNKLGMGLQAAATPGVREEAVKQLNPVHVFQEIGKAWDEAYGTAVFGKADDLSVDMDLINKAFASAKKTDDVAATLRKAGRDDLADAVDHGVLDGFVSTEEIISKLGSDPKYAKFWDIYNAPGKMFQALEQRGRLMTFKNLRQKTGDPAKAATLTKDALYDYRINSPENRTLRDVMPFAQFMAKSIPQSAKWMSQKPWVATAAAPLFYDPSGEEAPVYPYMQGRSRMAIGEDEKGNQTYLSGFGLPMESLDVIPNLSGGFREAGRDVSQGILASSNPWLKTAAGWVSGKDPYFGTAFGSYDKIPLVGNAGDLGRAFNVAAGTGFLEPAGMSMARQASSLMDESKPIGSRIADVVTGAKLTSVDPDVAQQRVINDYLETRPDIQQYRTYFKQGEPDAEFSSLMAELRAAKQRTKEKKAAAAAEGL